MKVVKAHVGYLLEQLGALVGRGEGAGDGSRCVHRPLAGGAGGRVEQLREVALGAEVWSLFWLEETVGRQRVAAQLKNPAAWSAIRPPRATSDRSDWGDGTGGSWLRWCGVSVEATTNRWLGLELVARKQDP